MSDWQPPGDSPWPTQPQQPVGYPPAWGQPYASTYPSGPPGPPPSATTASKLPWYRSTVFLVLGGLALLAVGGGAGALVTFVATRAAENVGDAFDGVTTEVTTYGQGGDLATFALGAGQCASQDVHESHGYAEGSAVPCELRHAIEHYASVEPPALDDEGSSFARADLEDFGDSACYLAFTPYVGVAYEDSDFEYATIIPSEAAWNGGARTIHCVLYEYDGTSASGSAHASRR